MEERLFSPSTPDRLASFEKAKDTINSIIRSIIDERKTNPPKHGEELYIDLLIENIEDGEIVFSDALTYIIGGYHTSGNTLTWGMYFLVSHPDVQDKLYKEITDILNGEDVDHANIGKLKYMKQVIDEILRCAVIAPYAARYQNVDSNLGGFFIPQNTPVVQAIGTTLEDEKIWSNPERFDPDRFSLQNSKGRSNMDFVPFGFAGKRVCPGQRFSIIEIAIALVTVLRKFKLEYVGNRKVKGIHGLVTHPDQEIWVTLQPR